MWIRFFFFNDTATTEIYTLSLHDALPISVRRTEADRCRTEADRSGTDLLHAGDRPRVIYAIDDQPKTLTIPRRLKMKKLVISMLAAASLLTVASATGASFPMSAVNGQTCVYMTSGLVCD